MTGFYDPAWYDSSWWQVVEPDEPMVVVAVVVGQVRGPFSFLVHVDASGVGRVDPMVTAGRPYV